MTYDLGLLAYADAVPLPTGEHRYCLACATAFLQRRRDQVYCGRRCQLRINMRQHRAGHARKGTRGRPRIGVTWA
jgi:predicted nucleic acid-binding Zn ribbon protein